MMKRSHRWSRAAAVCALSVAAVCSGCLERDLKPLNPCLVSGVVATIAVSNVDKVDLLFVVDNSQSMQEEQRALREQFRNLIEVLTTGDRDRDGVPDFKPAKDLHLGVVSTDLGLPRVPGVNELGCTELGDDGVMNDTPESMTGCQTQYPRFLSYTAGSTDPQQIATDFGCIASLGTGGCGFEMQLEAGLKALWPSVDIDPRTGKVTEPNRIQFLTDSNGFGALGQGDQANAGFLRTDPTKGESLLAVIVVSDEEDCSSITTEHLWPAGYLSPDSKYAGQELNLRCFHNKENLYELERYIKGFKALRPGSEHLVIFGAIVGVPENLVDATARAAVDFTKEADRNAYYDRILDDPSMVETPAPPVAGTNPNLMPSCVSDFDGDGKLESKAFPPRRIVEVARGFGENGIVQSICQRDFGPAIDAIIDVIANRLGDVCLPRRLVRNSDGMVGCNVVWELPPSNLAPPGTPTSCAETNFLGEVDPGRAAVTPRGGAVCKVTQLPVAGDSAVAGEGWFYDDFSPTLDKDCPGESKQRISFSAGATPPSGVTVKLECLNETQSIDDTRNDVLRAVEQPVIGDPCDRRMRADGQVVRGDAACVVTLADNTTDDSMFCHPQLNVCVQSCASDADCPAAWVCDARGETLAATSDPSSRPNGASICINPTCGDS